MVEFIGSFDLHIFLLSSDRSREPRTVKIKIMSCPRVAKSRRAFVVFRRVVMTGCFNRIMYQKTICLFQYTKSCHCLTVTSLCATSFSAAGSRALLCLAKNKQNYLSVRCKTYSIWAKTMETDLATFATV